MMASLDDWEIDDSVEYKLIGFRPGDEQYMLDRIAVSDLNDPNKVPSLMLDGQFVLEFNLEILQWVLYPIRRKNEQKEVDVP